MSGRARGRKIRAVAEDLGDGARVEAIGSRIRLTVGGQSVSGHPYQILRALRIAARRRAAQ